VAASGGKLSSSPENTEALGLSVSVNAATSTETIVPECMIYRKHFVALSQN
jgi:hypothetical protein